ncbi:MAG: fumarylacetoacetate hydrolase family protein [Pseudomonadota bacterium]
MRLARVEFDGGTWIADADPESQTLTLLLQVTVPNGPDPAVALIAGELDANALREVGAQVPFSQARFMPPILRPSKNVICVGKNYRAHAEEFTRSGYDSSAAPGGDSVPSSVIIFSKAACSLTGAHDDVPVPWQITSEVDYEAELGVVIGKAGRHIAPADAYAHVWGYTVINDVTARDLQAKHRQWLLGKSIDGFCPIGPWIVSADQVAPENLQVSCWVNGERRQHASTEHLIFDIPSIIATVSASMTLEPGDIIATGTPAGVGIGFEPPRFLSTGDVVKVSISDIGTLENRIV